MVEVTEAARQYLLARLADSGAEGGCFRIVAFEDHGYSLAEGKPKPKDLVLRHGDRVILAVEPDIAKALDGWVLDVEDSPSEEQKLLMIPAPGAPGSAPES